MKFTSLRRQDTMKLGLILTLIDPNIGRVLLLGDRGTGKSTAIRALKSFLPNRITLRSDSKRKNKKELFNLNHKKWVKTPIPLVELPLRATEDRLCGTIDLEKALSSGKKSFEPRLLAKANRRFLYVDEINLLDDHLVDLLLDSAASGWNTVERERISIQHPANILLVRSGNPEERALRPQLLDRFGMNIIIRTPQSKVLRMQIVRSILCDSDNVKDDAQAESRLSARISESRRRRVFVPKKVQLYIAQICVDLQIDRLRGDLVLTRASSAFAAWSNRNSVRISDVKVVKSFCLNHRLKKDPLKTTGRL